MKTRTASLCLFASLLSLTACKSAYVNAAVRNQTGGVVTLIEVDYPSASFGTELLAPGREYDYRFKILGGGGTKVLWTDAAHQQHAVPGPVLEEGQQGTLTVTLNAQGGADWSVGLRR